MVGIAAGGSEVTVAAQISRRDAAERTADLVTLIRAVAGGALWTRRAAGARSLARAAAHPHRRPRGQDAGHGRHADQALLWAVPKSDLERTVGRIMDGAREGRRPANSPRSSGRPWW